MIEITVKRDNAESSLPCDGYVLVAWNLKNDGTKVPSLNTSEPPKEAGQDLVHAVGALALAMSRHSNPGVQVMGKLVKAAMSNGFSMISAAADGEIGEG